MGEQMSIAYSRNVIEGVHTLENIFIPSKCPWSIHVMVHRDTVHSFNLLRMLARNASKT